MQHLRDTDPADWVRELDTVIGTDVPAQESVVAAFAIVAVAPSPWDAVCLSASVGGDTDTIAAIAGAMTGAQGGIEIWPADVVQTVREVNGIDFDTVILELLELRTTSPRR